MRVDIGDAAISQSDEAAGAEVRRREGLPHQRDALAGDGGVDDQPAIRVDRP